MFSVGLMPQARDSTGNLITMTQPANFLQNQNFQNLQMQQQQNNFASASTPIASMTNINNNNNNTPTPAAASTVTSPTKSQTTTGTKGRVKSRTSSSANLGSGNNSDGNTGGKTLKKRGTTTNLGSGGITNNSVGGGGSTTSATTPRTTNTPRTGTTPRKNNNINAEQQLQQLNHNVSSSMSMIPKNLQTGMIGGSVSVQAPGQQQQQQFQTQYQQNQSQTQQQGLLNYTPPQFLSLGIAQASKNSNITGAIMTSPGSQARGVFNNMSNAGNSNNFSALNFGIPTANHNLNSMLQNMSKGNQNQNLNISTQNGAQQDQNQMNLNQNTGDNLNNTNNLNPNAGAIADFQTQFQNNMQNLNAVMLKTNSQNNRNSEASRRSQGSGQGAIEIAASPIQQLQVLQSSMTDIISTIEVLQNENNGLKLRMIQQKSYLFQHWLMSDSRILLQSSFQEWKKLLYKKRSLELVRTAIDQTRTEETQKYQSSLKKTVEALEKKVQVSGELAGEEARSKYNGLAHRFQTGLQTMRTEYEDNLKTIEDKRASEFDDFRRNTEQERDNMIANHLQTVQEKDQEIERLESRLTDMTQKYHEANKRACMHQIRLKKAEQSMNLVKNACFDFDAREEINDNDYMVDESALHYVKNAMHEILFSVDPRYLGRSKMPTVREISLLERAAYAEQKDLKKTQTQGGATVVPENQNGPSTNQNQILDGIAEEGAGGGGKEF